MSVAQLQSFELLKGVELEVSHEMLVFRLLHLSIRVSAFLSLRSYPWGSHPWATGSVAGVMRMFILLL